MLFEVYILSSGRISAKYFMVSPSYVPDLDLLFFFAGITLTAIALEACSAYFHTDAYTWKFFFLKDGEPNMLYFHLHFHFEKFGYTLLLLFLLNKDASKSRTPLELLKCEFHAHLLSHVPSLLL